MRFSTSSCFITNVASAIWWRQLCPHIALFFLQWQPTTLRRQDTENSKQIFPEMKLRGLCPNSYIYVSVSDWTIGHWPIGHLPIGYWALRLWVFWRLFIGHLANNHYPIVLWACLGCMDNRTENGVGYCKNTWGLELQYGYMTKAGHCGQVDFELHI